MNINEAAPGRPPASTPHMKGETMNLIAMALVSSAAVLAAPVFMMIFALIGFLA